jgi:predicted phosphate transport protein (TIGR00153 family)
MKLSFLPREEKFFTLFHESAANVKATAVKLLDLMENYENVPEKVAEIKRLEEVGDTVIHTIMTSLHKTFVTPLDREDIAALGERLDDIVDSMEEAARLMLEYRIQEPTENAKELSRILLRCSETLEQAVGLLHNRGAKLNEILPLATVINTFENEADQVVSRAMAELFDDDASPLYVIKWKEVYDLLEGATDHCEVAANMLEGIVLKHA